jgi:6-phosphogluconate dehydrogenase
MNLHGLSRRNMAAVDEAVPADVLSAALYDRFRSCEEHTFAEKMLSPTRQGFGRHNEAKPHGPSRMAGKA